LVFIVIRFPIDFAGHRYNTADATAQPMIMYLLWTFSVSNKTFD